jgi:hypothetical protein
MAAPLSLLAILPSLADCLAGDLAPPWLIWVGPRLGGHFPAPGLPLRVAGTGLLR